MIATAVTFFDVVLFFHITAVVLTFGPTFAYPVFLAAAERTGGRAVPAVGQGIAMWERFGSTLGLGLVLATGIYLAADRWDFSEFFINWGFLAVIVLGAMALGFFPQRGRRLNELAERDIKATPGEGPVEFSEEYRALSAQIARGGQIAGILVILTIYFMTAKPFL